MPNRREILLTGVAAGALMLADIPPLRAARDDAGALDKLFDSFMSQNLDRSPIFATSLGLDTGARAHQRGEVDDNSLKGIADDKAVNADQLRRLKAFDRNSVSGMDQLNYDIVMFNLQTRDDSDKRYEYGPAGAGAPYALSQLTGL